MRTNGINWTQKDDDFLRKMLANGWSFLEIASKMPGRTRSSVAGRVSRLKLVSENRAKGGRPSKTKIQRLSREEKQSKLSGIAALPDPVRKPFVDVNLKLEQLRTDTGIRFMDIKDNQCHCLLDSLGPNGETMYCGLPVINNSSWCTYHFGRFTEHTRKKGLKPFALYGRSNERTHFN